MDNNELRLWVFGDAHVGTDIKRGRESLIDALRQSEGTSGDARAPAFEWDLAIDVGDMSGAQGLPEDDEGREVGRQLAVLSKHRREQIYSICGNHDRNGLHQPPAQWWQRWVDPVGDHAATSGVDASRRPYPIDGTWERYSFRAGNILFLLMSDINEPSQRIGRGDLGGNPAGVVSDETFQWWREQVQANRDAIIITAHHYVLKETTVASGDWEGMERDEDGNWKSNYHGYKEQGSPRGASYLYWVGGREDAGLFEGVLAEHPGCVDLWFGGHTHTHPDDTHGNKTHVEHKWGTWFVNASALSQYHGPHCVPMSRHLTFQHGSAEVLVRCYLHSALAGGPGWYAADERRITLGRPFDAG